MLLTSDGRMPNRISLSDLKLFCERFKRSKRYQISTLIFPQISNLLATKFKSNLESLIFVINLTRFVH